MNGLLSRRPRGLFCKRIPVSVAQQLRFPLLGFPVLVFILITPAHSMGARDPKTMPGVLAEAQIQLQPTQVLGGAGVSLNSGSLTSASHGAPLLEAELAVLIDRPQSWSVWPERADLFPALSELQRRDGEMAGGMFSAGVPLILETRFNPAAKAHLRESGALVSRSVLDREPPPKLTPVPPLPAGAKVIMAAWWPVAHDAPSPLPVWSAHSPTRPSGSNGYLSWQQVIAINPNLTVGVPRELALAGRFRAIGEVAELADFHYQQLDQPGVVHWNSDASAQKLSRMVLGRGLVAGDYLVLVALHLYSGNGGLGEWGTLWWGDARSGGELLPVQPKRYRYDSTADPVLPLESDGSPNRCFNPWLEGGLMDAGAGNGLDANCISCHQRASHPATNFLNVTRGHQRPVAATTATGLLWTPALQLHRLIQQMQANSLGVIPDR